MNWSLRDYNFYVYLLFCEDVQSLETEQYKGSDKQKQQLLFDSPRASSPGRFLIQEGEGEKAAWYSLHGW